MKRILLLKVKQNGQDRYLGSANALDLVRMAKKAEMTSQPEAQRPIEPKRLEELAEFIHDDGTLSTSIVIGTCDDRIKVQPIDSQELYEDLYYTEFPETEEEFSKYQDCFDIMDGQHRLFSFLPEYCRIRNDADFDLSFEMYIKPTLKAKRLIFKNTNEKQKSVAPNLLMWFRNKLDLLEKNEKEYYNIVVLLNNEASSPLNGRIIMGAEQNIGGIKAKQLIELFSKLDLKSIRSPELDDDMAFNLIKVYLTGWEEAVGSKISKREYSMGPFSKMAGIRYMMDLLPTFYELALSNQKKFNTEFVKEKVYELFDEVAAIEPREFFDKNSEFNAKCLERPFASESATNKLAKDHANLLKNKRISDFDPLA